MAANFWVSSHFKLLREPEDAVLVHPLDQHCGLTPEDIKIIKIHFANRIRGLAQLVKLRQRVVATAITFFRRVYLRKSFSELDPQLVAPTCLYLASKVEETTVQAKLLLYHMKKRGTPYDVKDLLEMEMHLLEALDFSLVVFHPYRPLAQFLEDAGLVESLSHTCWSLVNDSYNTELGLTYSPHLIALASICMGCSLKGVDSTAWLEGLQVDMRKVRAIVLELFHFYEHHRNVPEERVTAALIKLPIRV